ncbi:hypothetical protein ASD62_11030 [Phycicoccus sp. Root563]|uniref:hypothetical protein n=1 Tax=unclassified Phycicoccus TaxID=2637926 RepID=UPI000702CA68|nr:MULTISPECIES: hypothetical protein [unclassified Phycicoccus]KQU65113.1 hypothetical protein ASC58_16440 [Phycicoccus sp. Root101]KQZ89757.1 hypothetical protein ASD62_11030 [Phycicoccus sp. Root563]
MTRRALLCLVGLLATVSAVLVPVATSSAAGTTAPSFSAAAPLPAAKPVILVGTGGLTWSDVSEKSTPALWSLLRDGSTAAISVRSVFTNTCPIDGWLSLSAGNRAAADGPGKNGARSTTDPCPPVPTVDSGVVPGWNGYVKSATDKKFDSTLGTLGETLASNKQCVQAVGPGAGVGAAYSSGAVPRYADYDAGKLTGLLSACRVTLVDVGALRDPSDLPKGEAAPQGAGDRARQAGAIDTRIGEVLQAAPSGSDVIVASLSDAGSSERLRLIAAKGPSYGPGTLTSKSTRQPGLVQSADLTVTLLSAAAVPVPGSLGGATLTRGSAGANSAEAARDRLRALVDFDEASHEVHPLVPTFFNGVVYTQLAIYLLTAIVWRRDFGSTALRLRLLRITRRVAIVASTVPASTFLANLIPWWRFPVPLLAIVASVGLFVAIISAIAFLGPWGRRLTGPLAVVSLATMLVLGGDVMLGGRLQISSLMGLQPVVGGRFYGMGNVTFALFATSALLLCIAVSSYYVKRGEQRRAALATLVIGLAAVVVDGYPGWGADGGGPPALLPGLAYLVLAILGIRMTWRRGALIGGVTVGLFLLVGFIDSLRAVENQSHLGRFFDTLFTGGAWDIVSRKLEQNISILFGNYRLALLVPIALVFVIYILARPTSWGSRALERSYEACPTLRPGLIALLVMLTIGFAINDSGVAIPANGAIIAVPLIIAVSVRVLEDEARSLAKTRASRRG